MSNFNEILTVFTRTKAEQARELERQGKANIIKVRDFPDGVPTYSDGGFTERIGATRAYFAVQFFSKDAYSEFVGCEDGRRLCS